MSLSQIERSKALYRRLSDKRGSVANVVAAFAVSACATDDAPLLPMRAPIPANLVSPCPSLTPLSDGSGAAVLRKLVEVSEEYHDCRRKHEALVQAVQPAPMTED